MKRSMPYLAAIKKGANSVFWKCHNAFFGGREINKYWGAVVSVAFGKGCKEELGRSAEKTRKQW